MSATDRTSRTSRTKRAVAAFMATTMAVNPILSHAATYLVRVPANISSEAFQPPLLVTNLEDGKIDFGGVKKGQSKKVDFAIQNAGGSDTPLTFSGVFDPYRLDSSDCQSGLKKNESCTASITFTPTDPGYAPDQTLIIAGNDRSNTIAIPLLGIGLTEAIATWSASAGSAIPLTAENMTFSRTGLQDEKIKTVFLKNVGNHDAQSVRFTLSGDTDHFRIHQVGKISTGGSVALCGIDAYCLADLKAGFRPELFAKIAYTPQSKGTHSVALIPDSANGTQVPSLIEFNGEGAFDASGAWSASASSIEPVNSLFATRTVGKTATKTIYLKNQGQYGGLTSSFSIQSEKPYFRIQSVDKIGAGYASQSCGAAISEDGLSAQGCAADAPGKPHDTIRVTLAYTPGEIGTHSATLQALNVNAGDRQTPMPEPLVLSGQGAFNAAGAWSSSYSALVAPTTSFLNYGSYTANTNSGAVKTFYLRNTGSYGALVSSFSLEGDTDRFRISGIYKASTSNGATTSCGATVSSDKLSTTTCRADDVASGSYKLIRVDVTYLLSGDPGAHRVRLIQNGEGEIDAGEPIELQGTAVFNAQPAYSSSYGSVAAFPGNQVEFQTVETGTTSNRQIYVFNTGTHGWLENGFEIEGDPNFKITSLQNTLYHRFDTTACQAGGVVASDGRSTTPCKAGDVVNSGYRSVIVVNLSYTGSATPSESRAVLHLTSRDGDVVASLPLVGRAEFNPRGVWSASHVRTDFASMLEGEFDFGQRVVGLSSSAVTKNVFMINLGAYGPLDTAFEIDGADKDQFQLVGVSIASGSGALSTTSCAQPVTISGKASTSCRANSLPNGTRTSIMAQVRYLAGEAGEHRAVLRAIDSKNGTVLPGELILNGKAGTEQFAAWSSAPGATTALTETNLTMPALNSSGHSDQTVYLRNTGANGALVTRFQLTGDTSQFIIADARLTNDAGGNSTSCTMDGATKTLACTAQDPSLGSVPHYKVTIRLYASRPGTSAATLEAISENGVVMPEAITFTNPGRFNPEAVWVGSQISSTPIITSERAFGTRTLNAPTDRAYYLRNIGVYGSMNLGLALSGESADQFEIVSFERIARHPTVYKQSCGTIATDKLSASGCTTSNPIYGTGGSSQYTEALVVVRYKASALGDHAATLALTSANGTVLPQALTLSGSAVFNAEAAWSSTPGATTALTETNLTMPALNSSGHSDQTVYLRNTGANGALVTRFQLTGDTSQFIIADARLTNDAGGNSTSCTMDGATKTLACTAQDPSLGSVPHYKVTIRLYASRPGTSAATLEAISENGVVMPEAITFTNPGRFNPEAVWTTGPGTTTIAGTSKNFGTRTLNAVIDQIYYVRNIGTYGRMGLGAVISGLNADQFEILSLEKIWRSTSIGTSGCSATIAADKLSASGCTADHIFESFPDARVTVRYKASALGDHTATLTLTSTNGTVLPQALTLSGKAAFDATAVWSSAPGATTAPSEAHLTMPAVDGSGYSYRDVYLRNTGANGALNTRFKLTGDTSQFRIEHIYTVRNEGNVQSTCSLQSGQIESYACAAYDVASSSGSHYLVRIRLSATKSGASTATLEAISGNGVVMPEAITFTNPGRFNPEAAWTTGPGTTTIAGTSKNFGTRTLNAVIDQTYYVRNIGTYGRMGLGAVISGLNADQFEILSLEKIWRSTSIGTSGCSATIAADKLSASGCTADHIFESFPDARVTVRYKASVLGDHAATLALTSANGTVLPQALTLSGKTN